MLTLTQISKSFPGVRALDSVHLEAGPGEVVALVGENGAGKSTLVKILAGIHQPDSSSCSPIFQRIRKTILCLSILKAHSHHPIGPTNCTLFQTVSKRLQSNSSMPPLQTDARRNLKTARLQGEPANTTMRRTIGAQRFSSTDSDARALPLIVRIVSQHQSGVRNRDHLDA